MKLLINLTDEERVRLLQGCTDALEKVFINHSLDRPLFALLVFDTCDSAQYAANCERQDMIAAMTHAVRRMNVNGDTPYQESS